MGKALAVALLALVCVLPASGSLPAAVILFNAPAGTGSLSDLVEVRADATGYQNLTPGEQTFYAGDQDGSWSPDGSRIVFASHRDSNVSTEIYAMNADGSDQQRLTHDGPEGVQNSGGSVFDLAPAWSPRGAVVAYLKDVNSAYDVWLMRPDGSDQRRETADGGLKTYLQWSPGGGRLIYAKEGDIYTLVEGDPPLRLATGFAPAWSPDGSRIAYGAADGLWTIGPEGQSPTRVSTLPAQAPVWSPDGSRIAFVGTRFFPELTNRFGVPSRQDIYTVGVDGGNLRRLTGPPGDEFSDLPAGVSPTWWPDGSRIFYLSQRSVGDGATTYVMNTDGSCEGRFAPEPFRLFRPVWRPDSAPGLGPIRCADLRLSLVPSPGPAALGRDSQLQIVLDNDGNEAATSVRLELKTTDPLAISNQNGGPSFSCTGLPQDLVCTLDAVAPGTPRHVFFAVRSARAGGFPISITVSAVEPDTDPTTNNLQTGAQVLPCTLVGTYRDDTIYGTPGLDRICALTGRDEVYGGAGNDYLDSGNGSDIVAGGPGRDVIMTKGGNDTVYARDGQRDVIDCGSERDIAVVDRLDVVSHCETVVRPKR